MILLQKGGAIAFITAVVVGILVLGISGYASILSVAAAGTAGHAGAGGAAGVGGPAGAAAAKNAAETFFYIAVVLVVVVAIMAAGVLGRSVRVTRELDKLIGLNRFQNYSPEASLRKLGPLGERFNVLFRDLNTISEKRATKMSALSALSAFLFANIGTALAATDVDGEIVDVSRSFAERGKTTRSEMIGVSLRTVFPDLAWNALVLDLRRAKSFVSLSVDGGDLTAYPIENRDGELAYIIVAPEKPGRLQEAKARVSELAGSAPAASRTTLQRLFGGLTRRRRND